MRYLALGLCFLLGACCWKNTCGTREYAVIRESSRPVKAKAEFPQQPLLASGAQGVAIPNAQPMYYNIQTNPVVYVQDVPVMQQQYVMQQEIVQQPVQTVYQRQIPSPYVPAANGVQVADGLKLSGDMAHCVVVLQHPQARDLARCLNTDFTCIAAYEKLGYVQMRYTPQFSGAMDVEVASDYPARSQRVNNNIPRW